MAGNIKGITIEIAGDTTKLGKALASANKEIKNAQSNLKSVEKALKLDPTNVEMLKAKQNALNDVIKETKEKLDMEKEAAEQAKQALDTGEISQSEYDALQAEIVQTTKNLEELEKQAKQSASVLGSQMQAAGDKIQAVGDKIGNVGESMTKNVTAPIAAVGGASLVAFNEVDKGLDTVIEKTGATGEELEQMQQMVKDISTEIPTDFATAGEAVGEVNTRFGVTGDELEDLSEKFIKFASLNKKDVTSSVDSVQKSLSAFGLGVDHADELLDTLNATAQKTGVDVDSLTAGLIQNGTAFQEMGLSIEQSVALMGQMEKSGANSETVMQGLRKALKNATEEGIPLNQALSDLQDTIRNGTNDMDGLTAAYDLFGKSGDQIYGAVKNGTLDFEALADSINDNLGSVEGTYANTLDGMDDMKVSMNALKVAGAELGSSIASTVAPMFQKLSAILKNVAQWWDNLNPKTQDAIIKIAMVVAVIGPLLSAIGKISTGIGALVKVGGSLATFISGSVVPAITGVGTMITGTIIPAITAVAAPILAVIAVITAIIVVIKNWKAITELAGIVWDALKNAVLNAWESIKQKWDEAVEFFQGIWDNISQSADFLVQSVIGFFTSCWENIQEAWSTVVEFFQGIWDSIQAAADLLVQTVTGFFTTAWDNIKLVYENAKAYDVSDGSSIDIIDIRFTSAFAMYVIFQAEVLLDIDTTVSGITYDDAVVKVSYILNSSEIEYFHPTETYVDGKHILHLANVFSIDVNAVNRLVVTLNLDGGYAHIPAQSIRAAIYGQGLAASEEWDGFLDFSETVSDIPCSNMSLDTIRENVIFDLQNPIWQSMTETVSEILLGNMVLDTITEDLTAYITEHAYIDEDNVPAYDDTAVEHSEGAYRIIDGADVPQELIKKMIDVDELVDITSLTVDGTNITLQFSDDGEIWKSYVNSNWIETSTEMTVNQAAALTIEDWTKLTTTILWVKVSLNVANSSLAELEIEYVKGVY